MARMLSRRVAGPAAVVAGVCWMLYGVLAMLQPWGVDVVYREAEGYSVVVDTMLFVAYSAPGGIGVVLASIGVLAAVAELPRPGGAVGRVTRGSAYVSLVLGGLSLVGVLALVDPLFTAGRIFGTVSLGVATTAASMAVRRANGGAAHVTILLVLGIVGMLLLPLWPLVYALQWVTPRQGAVFIALFGVGWLTLGSRLLRDGRPSAEANKPIRH